MINKKNDDIFTMVILNKIDSKLSTNIAFTCNGDANVTNHNALRVKVQRTKGDQVDSKSLSPLVFITTPNYREILEVKWIGKAPKKSEISDSEFNRIVKYVRVNWEMIVDHWCGRLTDREFLERMPSEVLK